jgi:DNA-binding NarL/FixJ family response regulator
MIIRADYPDIHVIGIAHSGEEAVSMIEQDRPDVVLMDIYMPGIGGIEAIRQIHAIAPDTHIIALTSSDSEGDVYEAIEAGAVGFATKDRDTEHIGDLVAWIYTLSTPDQFAVGNEPRFDKGAIPLSDEERRILTGIGDGLTDDQIAEQMDVTPRAIRRRIANLYKRLNIQDRLEAAVYAMRQGLVRADS